MNDGRPWHFSRFVLLLLGVCGSLRAEVQATGAPMDGVPLELLAEFRPLSVSRKLFKVHRPDPVALVPPTEREKKAIQEEIGSELNIIENEVRALDQLVDRQTQAAVPSLKPHRRERRRLRSRHFHRRRAHISLHVPKFDPIMSSSDPMRMYKARMRSGFRGNPKVGTSSDLSDLIVRNAPILRQLPSDGLQQRGVPSGGKMYSLSSANDFLLRPYQNGSWRAVGQSKLAKDSSDTFYELLDKPHPAAGLPKVRLSGDAIARINRRYAQQNIARRQMPIHDLKEEYRRSDVALDQLFGPRLPPAHRRHHRKAGRIRRRTAHHHRPTQVTISVIKSHHKRRIRRSRATQNPMQRIF